MSTAHLKAHLNVDAVLFDLDGTLLDTAPDLARAANAALAHGGHPLADLDVVRSGVTRGARGMLRLGHPELADDAIEALVPVFLEAYEADIARQTVFFPGIEALLDALDAADLPWAVVTNKREDYAAILLRHFRLNARSAALVGGDTLDHAKPHPAPLQHACTQLGVNPERCMYVGDAVTDIQAGQAANMTSVAVTWGYGPYDDPQTPLASWGADYVIDTAKQLGEHLGLAR